MESQSPEELQANLEEYRAQKQQVRRGRHAPVPHASYACRLKHVPDRQLQPDVHKKYARYAA